MQFVRCFVRWPSFVTCTVLCLGLGLLSGCGGESAGDQVTNPPPPPPLSVPDGTFDVASTVVFNTCATAAAYDEPLDIQIDESSFSAGTEWVGTWDAKKAEGFGESEHVQSTLRSCTITTWTTIHVKFSSEDEFDGEIVFITRLSGSCGQRSPCLTTWHIKGSRQ